MDELEASNLAEKIVNLDRSILSVGIVSNTGQAIAGYTRSEFRQKFPTEDHWKSGAFTKLWTAEAFRAATIFGSASTDEKLLSPLESIIINREKLKILLLSLVPARAIIIGAIVEKSANDSELVRKIKNVNVGDSLFG